MIGLDTNILARYYIDIEDASPKTQVQRQLAKYIIENENFLFVSQTVILEFEWVLRGIYKFDKPSVLSVYEHLLTLDNIYLENRESLIKAIHFTETGLEFTDALHLAHYHHCDFVYSFDDKGFAKKAHKNKFLPPIIVPTQ